MFFILSKVLLCLIFPVTWLIGLFLGWLILKKKPLKKKLGWLTVLLLVVFSNPWLYRTTVLHWQVRPTILPDSVHYSTAILLGGMSGYDKNNQGFFSPAADRFIQAVNLFHRGIVRKVLITSGSGGLLQNEPPEADFIHQQLRYNGIPDSAIIVESRSRNTYENGIFSKKILDSLHLKPPFVLVTSAYHMRRSIAVFKKVQLDCIPYPADFIVIPERFDPANYFIPNPKLLKDWGYLFKEMAGLLAYKLTGKA
ncbi:MAG TPA: YdcF family protein [Sediminibacterium sp.]|nr:YdcF family protein [Sediminibacterium sp.]